jgi:hypothetical protein
MHFMHYVDPSKFREPHEDGCVLLSVNYNLFGYFIYSHVIGVPTEKNLYIFLKFLGTWNSLKAWRKK